jgi:hypothetical protein
MKIKAIITGSTGMVGEGVLYECLQNNDVEQVLVINRKHCGMVHPKLKEIIHTDFFDLTAIKNQLEGYNACFFCLGVSSVGMDNDTYFKLTYTLTISFAETLSKLNPDMVFSYVSGAGTDSSEKGRIAWARVKGKTENDLMKLPFKDVYAFRPGFIRPTKGLKNTHSYYKYFLWLFPLGRALFKNYFSTLKEIGLAMINVSLFGFDKKILNGKEIAELACKSYL